MGDERYASNVLLNANWEALLTELEPLFLTRTALDWEAALRAAEVPCAAVRRVGEALALPAVRSVWTLEFGLRVFGNPVRISGHDAPLRPVPPCGEQSERLRREFEG